MRNHTNMEILLQNAKSTYTTLYNICHYLKKIQVLVTIFYLIRKWYSFSYYEFLSYQKKNK
ncbi:hypothetical protein C1645_785578 [Glomus cerebriforme]|uniref:Uncharacterized protein n=1 Tax=Glomus cerebriforme TaxID=658196 RepID=A0A397SIC9_9GLOM|nr:hypothetical protein C1645_785578 [Glomus cerebriforme]